jgi:hypothetical protein
VCVQPSLRKSFAPERAQYDFFPPILAEIFVLAGLKSGGALIASMPELTRNL